MTSIARGPSIAACSFISIAGTACTELLSLPAGSERFEPPPEYQLWWSMTESCSGLRGSFADIAWSSVPGVNALPGNDEHQGEWIEQGNRIVLAGAHKLDGGLVRHEMLHALARVNGHPRLEFLERCAGIVVCAAECISDAGPAPIPSAGTPMVEATALDIGVEIEPIPTRLSRFNGAFALVVTAHNPANHAVIVQLPPEGGDNLGVSFQYLIGSDSTGEVGGYDVAHESGATFFRAGETKQEAFDLRIGNSYEGNYPPGKYTARGVFGTNDTPAVPFTLAP
jgi:hypothetical protein